MRRIFKSFMLVAAAAMAFTSCQKEEVSAPETVSVNLTMHAGVEETKTYLGENNEVLWGKDEAVKLYVGAGETVKFVSSESTDAYEKEATASFEFSISDVETSSSYNLGGIYPASAAVNNNENPAKFKVTLPDVQTAEVGKYDPSAYIMVLKPETVETLPTEYQASFRRATALNKITLTGVKENITSVEITVPEGKDFAGRRYFNLIEGTSGDIYYGQTSTITVNAPYTGESIDVWFCSWGVELAAGEELTVKMCAAENTYTRTITAKDNGITFAEGKLNTLKISMADINPDEQEKPEQPEQPDGAAYYEKVTSEPADWSGKYLIVWGNNAHATLSGKDLKSTCLVTIVDNKIAATDAVNAAAMTVTKAGDNYNMTYPDGKYFAVAHNSSSSSTSAFNLSFAYTASGVKISGQATNSGTTSTYILYNNQNQYYRCYVDKSSNSQYTLPSLYKLVEGDDSGETPEEPDTTPSVKLDIEDLELTADESKGTIGVDAKNIASIVVRALVEEGSQDESGWLVAEYDEANSCVAYSAEVNESEESRTAYIEVYCLDADGNEIVAGVRVTQVGVATENEIQKLTVAEFIAAEVDENVYYELEGTITRVDNTTYGNFDLTDDTGTVYIYGLCSEDGTTNKYWSTSGAKLGDDIVIRTIRADFNGPQGKNAWFVSLTSPGTRAFYTLDTEAVDFTSEGGSKDVTVTAYNTTAAVTASSDNAKFTVSVNGYKVTISSTANDLEEVVSGNITIKVGDLVAKTVKVTLAAKPASGVVEGGHDDFHTITSTNTSYVTGKTTAGWNYKNCAIFKGGTSDSSPAFKMIGDASNRALCMNGKTSAVGSITSPTLTTGCGTLKFNYGLPFGDTKIKFRVDIMQDGAVVKTFTVEKSSATKYTKYSHEVEINVAGDFQIVFTNLSPSNSTSNKDRTAVWDVEWTGYKN